MTIYLDNHATTPCDPVVLEAMQCALVESFGNPHSRTHAVGRAAAETVEAGLADLGGILGCAGEELVVTSGATESNCLALMGVMRHPRNRRRRIVSVQTEHPAVLDPVKRLESEGFEVIRLPVLPHDHPQAGRVDLNRLDEAVTTDTALVSIMRVNNEIGVIQPIQEIAGIVHDRGALLHTDAAQAVGREKIDIQQWDVDLLSVSAHKCYAPKGMGLLYVRQRGRRVRLLPLFEGGGQQQGLRSGTINPAAVVAMQVALQRCEALRETETHTIRALRDRLWQGLSERIPEIRLNGPAVDSPDRIAGNLNVQLPRVEGESLMIATPEIAVSSGSACSSAEALPSHVLMALGIGEAAARRSLRFGIGRFNTAAEIEAALDQITTAYATLVKLL